MSSSVCVFQFVKYSFSPRENSFNISATILNSVRRKTEVTVAVLDVDDISISLCFYRISLPNNSFSRFNSDGGSEHLARPQRSDLARRFVCSFLRSTRNSWLDSRQPSNLITCTPVGCSASLPRHGIQFCDCDFERISVAPYWHL